MKLRALSTADHQGHSLSKIMWKKLNFSILKGLINWNEKASVSGLPIAHLHDDVTRALHAGICSQEKNNMAARSGGGFTCCVPGCFTNSKRDTHLSFYVFPKEKNLRRRWLHSISIFYTGLTFGQFVALFNFLNAHGICYRLNYWGSDYDKVQLPDIEKKGQKRFL